MLRAWDTIAGFSAPKGEWRKHFYEGECSLSRRKRGRREKQRPEPPVRQARRE